MRRIPMKEEKRPLDISEQSGLTEELSDEDLENVAGGALSYVVIARFSNYYSDPMPLYGVWTRMPVSGHSLT